MQDFVHLHNHTHYSLLDAACKSEDLIDAAVADENKAIAITDHGVMYGCFEFYKLCKKKGIKPILGFEAYIAPNSRFDKTPNPANARKGNYYHLVLLAKDWQGYKNLMKLSTIGHTEGFYYRPRIDKEVLEKYKDGLIVSSACLAGPINKFLLEGDYQAAKAEAQYYKDLFGDDFYIELQNHHLEKDKIILDQAPKIAAELGIKMIATNDIHYVKPEHAIAHNILLLINKDNSKGDLDITKLRYGTPEFYFRTRAEMNELFRDFPDAIANTIEVADKCEVKFEEKLYMPDFPIPKESKATNLNEYFTELVWEGFHERYPDPPPHYADRLKYELEVIIKMGFPGYFLIVQDFVRVAKFKLGVSVGPGRGSAAGSMVAYCLHITNVDPMPYDLLFERFLNPERNSMPDIDIDFADTRRHLVIDYVRDTYGADAVAQIITFGQLSTKACLKDVGRVLGIDHNIINNINKKIPVTTKSIKDALELPELKDFKEDKDPVMKNLKDYSMLLEGLYRHSGIHAAGVVIAPADCMEFVPLVTKDNQKVAQFTMKYLEDAGLVKMDFLGLKTLTIIDDTLDLIEQNHGIRIDLDKIDFLDQKTYDLFGAGKTFAVFQFESKGMQEYLSKLKPNNLEELTAMNALYRPGPMDNIPTFIARKQGREDITYLHPLMEKALKKTYGIIVYQEQVMQLVQDLAGFSLGQADILRRAMGKKNAELMAQQKATFSEGAAQHNIDKDTASAIYDLIEKFAGYGFNKSHALAYSYLAYQTAYLKANYPAEFLAANMTSDKDNLERIVLLVEEAQNYGIKVLPPDVNSSSDKFNVVNGNIYYSMAAIKNVGTAVVENIVQVRQEKPFESFFDFAGRLDNHYLNKRVLEALIYTGAFDSLNPNRASLFESIELALNYNKALYNDSINKANSMDNLFGGDMVEAQIPEPKLIPANPWPDAIRLEKEKEFINFYVSGHPLDSYNEFIKRLSKINLSETKGAHIGSQVRVCGLITAINKRTDKKGKPIAFVTIEDFYSKAEVICWSNTYEKFANLIAEKNAICVVGKCDAENEANLKIYADTISLLDDAIRSDLHGYSVSMPNSSNELARIDDLNAICTDTSESQIQFKLKDEYGNVRTFIAGNMKVGLSTDNYNKLCSIFGKSNVSIY